MHCRDGGDWCQLLGWRPLGAQAYRNTWRVEGDHYYCINYAYYLTQCFVWAEPLPYRAYSTSKAHTHTQTHTQSWPACKHYPKHLALSTTVPSSLDSLTNVVLRIWNYLDPSSHDSSPSVDTAVPEIAPVLDGLVTLVRSDRLYSVNCLPMLPQTTLVALAASALRCAGGNTV